MNALNISPSPLAREILSLMPPLRRAIMDVSELTWSDPRYAAAAQRDADLQRRYDELCHRFWRVPAMALDDHIVRAQIAQFDLRDWPAPYQPHGLYPNNDWNQHESVAELIRGLLQAKGLPHN